MNILDHGVIGYVNFYILSNTKGLTTSVPIIATIDRWALLAFTILFFAYQIGTLIWMYAVPWKRRRMMFEKDNHHRLQIEPRLGMHQSKLRLIDWVSAGLGSTQSDWSA